MNEPKKKILVADDDTAILEVLTLILEDAGYDVKTTHDGQTERCAREYKPDLILLDIWMSGIDGRVICKRLKSKKNTKNIPIIMVSANKDTAQIAKEAESDAFITKPFEMEELLSMVKKYTSA